MRSSCRPPRASGKLGIGHHAVRFTKPSFMASIASGRLRPHRGRSPRHPFLQDSQREEHGDALPWADWWKVNAAGHRNGIHPHPSVGRQIFGPQSTTLAHAEIVQPLGQFSAVHRISAILANVFSERVFWQLNLLAGPWRATIPGERAGPTGEMTKLGRRLGPVRGLKRDPKTIMGYAIRLKQPGHGQLPKPFVQGEPRVDRSGVVTGSHPTGSIWPRAKIPRHQTPPENAPNR